MASTGVSIVLLCSLISTEILITKADLAEYVKYNKVLKKEGSLQPKYQTSDQNTMETSDRDSNILLETGIQCSSPWEFSVNNTSCRCGHPQHDYLSCNTTKNLTILNGFCATYQEQTHATQFGRCLYTFKVSGSDRVEKHHSITLPKNIYELNQAMCEPFNRNGTLCGKCKDGFYPLVYSFNMTCVKCPNGKSNWWKFALAAFLPTTLFYFIILLFKINVTSSNLYGFVYCSQVLVMPAIMRVMFISVRTDAAMVRTLKYVGTFYGIWNLDFLRFMDLGICLKTGTLQTLALDLIAAIYPFFLMFLTYILIELHDRNFTPLVVLWKPFAAFFAFFHRNWEIRTSLIDAFATFFLLTNVKFVSVSFDILSPVVFAELNLTGHYKYTSGVYYDPSIPYFGDEHVPYAYLATAILIFLILLPLIILLLYPFCLFQKFLNLFPFRWYVLHTFMDAFQGCYKDGTQPGTRDCRWFAPVLIITRIVIMLIGAATQSGIYFPITTMIFVLVAILIVKFQPFKANLSYLSDINAIFILILAIWYASLTGVVETDEVSSQSKMPFAYATAVLAGVLPLLYISAIIAHWLYRNRKFGSELISRFHARTQGYNVLQ